MAKPPKNGRTVGKCGASLRKIVIIQHSKYICTSCDKGAMKRAGVGIWSCTRYKRVVADGDWVYSTTAAAFIKFAERRLRETKKQ